MIDRVHVWAAQGTRVMTSSLLSVLAAGCCFGGVPNIPPPPVTSPGPGGGTTVTTPPVAASAITLAPGFAPDPTLTVGNAGGPVEASTMGGSCRGTIGAAPNITLTTTAAISGLRVVVSSPQDTTLVVRLADGTVLCDDDGGGYPNPMVSGSFPAGSHSIYVGTYSPSATGAGYTLAFTTNPTVNAGSLGTAPPPTIPPTTIAGGTGPIPRNCGSPIGNFGPLSLGSSVVLGVHSSYTGPNGSGGMVLPGSADELNWAPDMQPFVGQRTTVTSLEGADTAGCTVIRVAADNGSHFWRVRDMTL